MYHLVRAQAYRAHWRIRGHRAPHGLLSTLDRLHQSQFWPAERLLAFRTEKLRHLVAHAYAQIPGYRRLMDEAGVRPADIRTLSDITLLPVMSRALLKEHGEDMLARDVPPARRQTGATGGTTGEPMKWQRDAEGSAWQRAAYWRGFEWAGLRLGAPWAQLFGGSMGVGPTRYSDHVRAWFAGKVFLPAFELTEDNVQQYAATITRAGARHLVGYASACYEFARLCEKRGVSLALEVALTTAESLEPKWEQAIRAVFGARALPYYGCGEVQSIGYSCPETPGVYHVSDEHVVLEVEPSETGAAPNEGPFLVTDLDNLAMPFIRYRNGDAGVLAEPGCACGRTLGRILRIDGRVSDVLLTASGQRISGAIGAHAFRLVPSVEAYQIVQDAPGHVELRVVRQAGYDASAVEPELRQIFSRHLGRADGVTFTYVERLERSRAGKARFVINRYLANQQL